MNKSENTQKFFKAPRYLLRKLNIISMISGGLKIKTFIDIGCGAGELACTLGEMGYSGVGVDFSEDALKTANKIKSDRLVKNVKFKNTSLDKISDSYDVAIACEILGHVEDDLSLLREIVNLSNRYVIVSVPSKMKYFDDFDRRVGHFRRYEKVELVNLLKQADLKILDFRSYGYPFINVTRLIRKAGASKVKKQKSMEDSTKQSGINPIKLPSAITRLDMENILKPAFWFSKMFNRFDLSEGYVVLAEKRVKR